MLAPEGAPGTAPTSPFLPHGRPLCLSACPQGHDVAPHAPRPVRSPPPAAPSGITPLTQRRNPPPQCKGGVRVPPEAPSGASPPHAARHNITPAPVKPQGVPVRRPPPAKSSPESPRVHNQSLSSRDAPPQRKAGVRVPPEAPSGASTPHGKAQYPPSARKATGGTRAAASPTEADEPQAPPSKTHRHTDRAPPSGLSPCPRLIYP